MADQLGSNANGGGLKSSRRDFLIGSVLCLAGGAGLSTLSAGHAFAQVSPDADTLVIGVSTDVRSMQIPVEDPGLMGLLVVNNTTDSLVNRNAPFTELVPGLAETLPDAPDSLEIVYKIRSGLKFHDGSDLTAKDVLFTLNEVLTNPQSFDRAIWNEYVASIDTPDDMSVRFQLKKPWPFLNAWLGNLETPVVQESAFKAEGFGRSEWSGSGPFKVTDWKVGNYIRLERADQGVSPQGKAKMKNIVLRTIPDASARLAALEAGQIDVDLNPDPKDVAGATAGGQFLSHVSPACGTTLMTFQTATKPFDDPRVRKALSLAVDRQQIADAFFYGFAEPAGDLFPSWHWAHDDSIQVKPDLEQARSLLAEAGASNLSFTAMVMNRQLLIDQAVAIQAQLAQIGVTMDVRPVEYTTLAGIVSSDDPKQWLGPVAIRIITPLSGTAYEFAYYQYGADGPLNSSLFNREGGRQNPEVEGMLREALKFSDAGPESNAKAKPQWSAIAAALNEDPPQLRLNFFQQVNLTSNKIEGWTAAAANIVLLKDVAKKT